MNATLVCIPAMLHYLDPRTSMALRGDIVALIVDFTVFVSRIMALIGQPSGLRMQCLACRLAHVFEQPALRL